MKRKIKSVVAMLLAVAMTVALLPQTNFAVNAAAEDFPIEIESTAKVATSMSGTTIRTGNKKNNIVIESDGTFVLSGIFGIDASELRPGYYFGFELDEDATGTITYDEDADAFTVAFDQESYSLTGTAIYTDTNECALTGTLTVDADGFGELALTATVLADGKVHNLVASTNDESGILFEDWQVAALKGEEAAGYDFEALTAALNTGCELEYTSEFYDDTQTGGQSQAQGKIGFNADGTAVLDSYFLFMGGLLADIDVNTTWSFVDGQLQVAGGMSVTPTNPETDLSSLAFVLATTSSVDEAGNTVITAGWEGTPLFKFVLTPEDVAAIAAFNACNVTIDGTVVATVQKGEAYTLPTTASVGYYANGEVYKPGAAVTVTEDVTLTSINELSVSMAAGAGIKASTPSGIRWQATVESDNMDLVASETVIKAGMLISANDLVENAGSLDKNSTYATKDVANSGWYMNNAGTYCAAIVGINEDNYTRDFVARAYVTVTYNDGTATTYYSDMGAVRSVETIAKAVAANGYVGLNSAEQAVVDSFIK